MDEMMNMNNESFDNIFKLPCDDVHPQLITQCFWDYPSIFNTPANMFQPIRASIKGFMCDSMRKVKGSSVEEI
jgi:hypothetical protein